MKNKSLFSKIILIVVIGLICMVATVSIALLLGTLDIELFDISDLNLSNVLPAIIIGGIITCIVVGLLIMVLANDVLEKVKEFLFESKDDKGEK